MSEKEKLQELRHRMTWYTAMYQAGWQWLPGGGFVRRVGRKRAYMPKETAVWYKEHGRIPEGFGEAA